MSGRRRPTRLVGVRTTKCKHGTTSVRIYPDQIASALKGTRLSMAKAIAKSENVNITTIRTSLGFRATVQGRWNVPWQSVDRTTDHEVNLQSTRLLEATCSCQDYARQGPLCKHGGAVLLALLSGRIPTDVPTWPTLLAIDDVVPVPAAPQTGCTSRPQPPSLLAQVLKDLQAAELELFELKGKLTTTEAALQASQAATRQWVSSRPPPIVQIVDAAGGHACRLEAIKEARSFVFIVAFTYDLDDVTQAVITAKRQRPSMDARVLICLLYTSPSPRDRSLSRMPSSA